MSSKQELEYLTIRYRVLLYNGNMNICCPAPQTETAPNHETIRMVEVDGYGQERFHGDRRQACRLCS